MTISASPESLYINGYWEDLRVTAQDFKTTGLQSPIWARVGDSGDPISSDYAIEFNRNNNEYGKIPASANYEFDNTSFAIAFLINPYITDNDNQRIIYKSGTWDIRVDDQKLKIRMFGKDTIECNILFFETNCIVINWEYDAGDCYLEIYNNNKLHAEYEWLNSSSNDNIRDIFLMCRRSGRNHLSGKIDELRIFNHILSNSQIAEFYNNGAGTTSSLTGATEIGCYHFNENTGNTVDNSANAGIDILTLYNTPTWVDGLVVNIGASKGVYGLVFPPSLESQVSFNKQFPHQWKIGTEFRPHAHIQLLGGSGTPVFGLEYNFANVDVVFPNTVTTLSYYVIGSTIYKNHIMVVFPPIDLSAITSVSAMIQCTLFRSNTGANNGNIGLLEFDFHYFKDAAGSRQEYYK